MKTADLAKALFMNSRVDLPQVSALEQRGMDQPHQPNPTGQPHQPHHDNRGFEVPEPHHQAAESHHPARHSELPAHTKRSEPPARADAKSHR